MRTTLNLDEELIRAASAATGVREKTALIHLGLRALVEKAARERLARLGGTDRGAVAGRRRRAG
jgi:Arc/MetJ family transcription regulator